MILAATLIIEALQNNAVGVTSKPHKNVSTFYESV